MNGRALILAALLAVPGPATLARDADAASTSALEWEFLEAETALAQGEPRIAASHYRGAVREAWFLLGLIEIAEDDLAGARDALGRARDAAAVDLGRARVALALVELRLGEVEKPLRELRLTAQEEPRNAAVRRRFAEALWAAGRRDELAAELEKLRALDPAAADELAAAAAAKPDGGEPALPDTGSLGAASREYRDGLRDRLAASLIRAYRNLAALHVRTGFTGGAPELEAAAEAVASRHPRAGDPFGKVDLTGDEPAPRISLPRLDPVALMASEPAWLHPAVELIDSGDFAAAETELRQLASRRGGAPARALLGRLLADQGDLEAARAELLQAVLPPPGPSSALQALARLYWLEERPVDAIRYLRRAAQLGPLERDLGFALAEVELTAGRPDKAEDQLRSLAKRFDSVEALMQLAALPDAADREKLALEAVEQASRLAPNSEEVLLTHARLALEVGVVHGAARSAEPLVRMRPEVAEYRFLLGRVWSRRRKMGEASEAYLKAVELDPDYVPAFLPLGLALNHESRFEEAKSHLERYLQAHPEDPDALAGLAESEERLGDSETAQRRAQGVLSQDPENARAHLVLGMVRAGRGELAEARRAFEHAVDIDPLLAKAHYQLSLACARLADRACAAEHLERYKTALLGPEAAFGQLEAKAGAAVMSKQDPAEDGSPP